MKNWIGLAIVIPAGLVLNYLIQARAKRRILHHLDGRQMYTPQEFGEHYFPPDQAQVATQFRVLLSHYVPVDLARLSSNDKLVQDLGIGRVDGLECTLLVQDVERAFGISISDAEAEQILTVGQFVSYIALAQKSGAGPV